MVFKMSLSPNRCFILPENQEHIDRCKARGRGAALIADPTMGYQLWPLYEKPLPYYILDVYREAAASGVTGITGPTLSEGVEGVESPTTMATVLGLTRPPKDNPGIEKAVMKIAEAQVGKRLAGALADAWRDVDHALRLWPTWGDTNNFLFLPNSVMGDRWILRPIVPAPERLSEEDKAYFSKHRHMSRDRKDSDSFFIWHNTKNYKIDEMKWLVVIFDEMMRFMDRAMKTLDAARGKTGRRGGWGPGAIRAGVPGGWRRSGRCGERRETCCAPAPSSSFSRARRRTSTGTSSARTSTATSRRRTGGSSWRRSTTR